MSSSPYFTTLIVDRSLKSLQETLKVLDTSHICRGLSSYVLMDENSPLYLSLEEGKTLIDLFIYYEETKELHVHLGVIEKVRSLLALDPLDKSQLEALYSEAIKRAQLRGGEMDVNEMTGLGKSLPIYQNIVDTMLWQVETVYRLKLASFADPENRAKVQEEIESLRITCHALHVEMFIGRIEHAAASGVIKAKKELDGARAYSIFAETKDRMEKIIQGIKSKTD